MRLDAAMPAGEDPQRWRILARDLVTYPETVALATLLASRAWRLRVAADGGGHLPYRLADVPCVPGELGHRLRGPWLTERLADCTHGALFAWTYQCIRTEGGSGDDEQRLWQVPLTLRPRPLADILAGYQRRQTAGTEGLPAQKRLRGHSVHAEGAFAAGLAHARTYAAQHGHLATQRDTRVGSFSGKWVHNQQAHALVKGRGRPCATDEQNQRFGRPARLAAHDLMMRHLTRCASLRVLTVAGRTAQIAEVYQGFVDHLELWALEQDTRVLIMYDGQAGPEDTTGMAQEDAQKLWEQAVRNASPYRAAHRQLPLTTRRILEDPIMQDSRYSQFIQAADMVGYAAFHHLGLTHPEVWPKMTPVGAMSKSYRRLSQHWLPGHGTDGIVWLDAEST